MMLGVMAAALAVGAETVVSPGRMSLAGTWHVHEDGNSAQIPFPVSVPGCVHSALLADGRIPDPYYGQNELLTQEVGRKDWVVERSFAVKSDLLKAKSVILRLEDVDTFCTISINGQVVGKTDNRFRRWDFDVKKFLRSGDNRIVGVFRSAENESNERAKAYDHEFRIANTPWAKAIELIRKPQCHGGWDWGLAQMVTGFCGPVELVATDTARIDYVYCDQDFAADYSSCGVTVTAEVTAPAAVTTVFRVAVGGFAQEKQVALAAGANKLTATINVPDPELWWPNGQGRQTLYPLDVAVGDEKLSRRIGLRKIEVLNTPDKDEKGKEGARMAFRVNGVEIFCKGANWIPCDAFESRQTAEKYRDLLQSAATANMNMIRLWGGGQFEHDAFYEICDELGLMVWHDMMFSCAIYPGDAAFLASVEKELAHQLRRLRDHASIALWCGDNECVGALNWFEPSRKNRPYYLKALQDRTKVEADAVATYDPARTFWPSSPCGGPGDYSDAWHNDNKGDMHNWTVW
ncbi:MAG: glycoside hydrolase family 2 protein, partial [Kiritimatiellia bacterium]